MPSPFPGMDPFLEGPDYFPDLHDSLINYLQELVQPRLPQPYFAKKGRRIWLEHVERPVGPDLYVVHRRASPARDPEGGVAIATIAETGAVVITSEPPPLVEMTGHHLFNEVFFTDAEIPADALIGEEGNGWSMARDTLDNERVTLSRAGLQWGWGPTALDLVAIARDAGGLADPVLRRRLVDAYIEHEVIRVQGLRMVAAGLIGAVVSPLLHQFINYSWSLVEGS
jgi:hypothetical protein